MSNAPYAPLNIPFLLPKLPFFLKLPKCTPVKPYLGKSVSVFEALYIAAIEAFMDFTVELIIHYANYKAQKGSITKRLSQLQKAQDKGMLIELPVHSMLTPVQ